MPAPPVVPSPAGPRPREADARWREPPLPTPSSARALRESLERDDARLMRVLVRGATAIVPLTLLYLALCWALGYLPTAALLQCASLSAILMAANPPMARLSRRHPALHRWACTIWILAALLAMAPALQQMGDFTARALLLAGTVVAMLWTILRQSALQQLLCGVAAMLLYALVAAGLDARRDLQAHALGNLLVLLGMAGAVLQIAYVADQVHRIRRARDAVARSLSVTADRLEHRALHDATTGLPNRAHLQRVLHARLEPGRARAPLSVCLFEPLRMRGLNDKLGESTGDEILRRMARAARIAVERDGPPHGLFLARFGGPRFALVMPGTTADAARDVVARLRQALLGIGLEDLMPGLALHVALGVATLEPDARGDGPEPPVQVQAERLLEGCATALQQARREGAEGIVALTLTASDARSRDDDPGTGPDADAAAVARGHEPAASVATSPVRAARIGSPHLPWPSPFLPLVGMSMCADIAYVALCWLLGVLAGAVASAFCALAAGAILVAAAVAARSRRMPRSGRPGRRAAVGLVLMLLAVPPVAFVASMIDEAGGRVGMALLNGAPMISAVLFLDRRRVRGVAATIVVGWLLVGVVRAAGGLPTHWPGDLFLTVTCCFFAACLAFVGSHVHAVRQRVAQYSRHLHELVQQMSQLSLHDPMTGLPNRRGIVQFLIAQIARAERAGAPLSVCIAEVHDDSRVQELWTAIQVERRARRVAGALSACTRDDDRVGRIGYGRFLFVLPATDRGHAVDLVSRMRAALAPFVPAELPDAQLTALFGVAQWSAGQRVSDLLQAAQDTAVRLRVGEPDARSAA